MMRPLPRILLLMVFVSQPLKAVEPAPAPIDHLLELGRVRIEFYPPPPTRRPFPGLTNFTLTTHWKYDFTWKSRIERRATVVSVAIKFQEVRPELVQVIELPQSYDDVELWSTSLMQHELDHVRLNTDPRALLLNAAVLNNLTSLEFTLPRGIQPTQKIIAEKVSAECEARRKAVVDLMNAQGERLDRQSRHGERNLEHRLQFFLEAYQKEQLAELKFPYLDSVLETIESEDYEAAGRAYLEPHFPPSED